MIRELYLSQRKFLRQRLATKMHNTIERNSNNRWVPQVKIIHWAQFRTTQVMNISEIHKMQSV